MNNLMRLAKLAEQRNELNDAKRAYYALKAEWEDETRPLRDRIAELEAATQETEAGIKLDALDEYHNTGSKEPAPGVKIRMMTHLSYDDTQALAWAKAHQIALALDRKQFERIAADGSIDFVRVDKVPQATIAIDIAAALSNG